MSLENVKKHFRQWDREHDIMEFTTSSATVTEAAETLGVEPAQIAKTLSFKGEENRPILIVTAGDAKIDNKKFKNSFQTKARMLSPEEVQEQTGHAVGGVCPFGVTGEANVYLDISMKRFSTVYPACGSPNSAIALTCGELEKYAETESWIDACKGWETASPFSS